MKRLTQSGELDINRIVDLLREPKANQHEKISLDYGQLRRLSPKQYTPDKIQSAIMRLVEADYQRRQRNRSAER